MNRLRRMPGGHISQSEVAVRSLQAFFILKSIAQLLSIEVVLIYAPTRL